MAANECQPELLPCPFCGGDPKPMPLSYPYGRETKYTIVCRSCAAEGGWAKNPLGARRWWNMRVAPKREEP